MTQKPEKAREIDYPRAYMDLESAICDIHREVFLVMSFVERHLGSTRVITSLENGAFTIHLGEEEHEALFFLTADAHIRTGKLKAAYCAGCGE